MAADQVLRVVVMDPLAAPLSCACVPGVGQRKYDRLAAWLTDELGRPVEITFDESLELALDRMPVPPHLIVGKRSVVLFDAARLKSPVRTIARLTDRDGATSLHGLFVVRTGDPAQSVADLKGRRIRLGPTEELEAHGAALEALRDADVLAVDGESDAPGGSTQIDTSGSIEAAIFAVTDKEADAAVVSGFLPPLLEACGKVRPGSLRIIGRTHAVPFVEMFTTQAVSAVDEARITQALSRAAKHADLLEALESRNGFVSIAGVGADEWADWRGPGRLGLSPHVPQSLPAKPRRVWTAAVTGPAMAGIAVSGEHVIVPDKDAELTTDVFRCFDAATGLPRWTLEYPADREVQYTNAPRATPVIVDGLVYLQGALGDLHCVELASGRVVWKVNLLDEFQADPITWGCSTPPLVASDRLIVSPGANDASVVALDRRTGKLLWKSPGHAASYAAFIEGSPGAPRGRVAQAIGYDVAGLGGWDLATGHRLWSLVPRGQADFHVGTPVPLDGRILVATENNATRLYEFDAEGLLRTDPVAVNEDLAPDTCTPVVAGDRVFGTAFGELFCLDLKNGLKTVWSKQDDMFHDHTNLVAGNGRVLIWTTSGDLLLIDVDADEYKVVSHLRPFTGKKVESMSHPALVGGRLYLRSGSELACLRLTADE